LKKSVDIYSLGCILHELVFGNVPSSNSSICSEGSASLRKAIHGALDNNPDTRSSIQELLQDTFIIPSSSSNAVRSSSNDASEVSPRIASGKTLDLKPSFVPKKNVTKSAGDGIKAEKPHHSSPPSFADMIKKFDRNSLHKSSERKPNTKLPLPSSSLQGKSLQDLLKTGLRKVNQRVRLWVGGT
jgi:serine/threonine protein kinase